MTITVNLLRMLDRKQWEMCNFAPVNSTVGSFVVSSNLWDQYQYYVTSATTVYCYDPFEDGWMQLPSPALVGAFGAGACGARHPQGPRSFPTAGTTTTVTTSLNLQRSLKGYTIRFIAGPNAGTDAVIASNTTGANSIITLQSALPLAVTTASEFILMTGRLWVMNATSAVVPTASGSFRYYDLATNTWNSPSITGLPSTWATDGRMVTTPGTSTAPFASGTSTGTNTTTTLNNTGKTWGTNEWTNYQVRITSGTGAGQFRAIASNTSTALTVSVAWTTTPDATSQYVIEGNDDNIYLLGNNAVTMYRYSIAGNTWTTLAPVAARAGAPVAGMSGQWVTAVTDTNWTNESSILNGKYIYSVRGNATTIDRYDIAGNTWESGVVYTPAFETFPSGTSYNYYGDYIWIMQVTPSGRLLKYNIAQQRIEPCSQIWYTQGATVIGDRLFDATITDGTTTLRWLYYITNTQNIMFRMLVF